MTGGRIFVLGEHKEQVRRSPTLQTLLGGAEHRNAVACWQKKVTGLYEERKQSLQALKILNRAGTTEMF